MTKYSKTFPTTLQNVRRARFAPRWHITPFHHFCLSFPMAFYTSFPNFANNRNNVSCFSYYSSYCKQTTKEPVLSNVSALASCHFVWMQISHFHPLQAYFFILLSSQLQYRLKEPADVLKWMQQHQVNC